MEPCRVCNREGCVADLLRKLCELSGNTFDDFGKIPHDEETDVHLSKYIADESAKKTRVLYNFMKEHNLLTKEMEEKYSGDVLS